MWWRWLLLILLWLPPLACTAGWVRSRFAQDLVQVVRDHATTKPAFARRYNLRSDCGVIAFEIAHDDLSHVSYDRSRSSWPATPPTLNVYFHPGLQVRNNYGGPAYRRWGVQIGYRFGHEYLQGFRTGPLTEADRIGWHRVWWAPYWLVTLLAALPAMLLSRWLIRGIVACRRRARGQCPACGYDLRASPDKCPECGAAAGPVIHASTALSS